MKSVRLEEIVEICSSKRIKMSEYVKTGIPFLRSKEIINLHKNENIQNKLFISEERFDEINKKFGSPSEGDILLTSVGTLGIPYQVKEEDKIYFKDGNLTWFRNFSEEINKRYLYFWLTSPIAKRKLDEITIGSTQKALTIVSLKGIEIDIPCMSDQNKIVEIIGSIQEKIELNQKMNETLEEIAKSLFKSWFIDFDPVRAKAEGRPTGLSKEISDLFPDSFEVSELGEIPMDWKVENIESLTSKIAMGPFGSDMKTSTYVEEGVPIISGKQMLGYLLTDEGNNFISPSHAQKLKNSLVQRGDIVITQTGTVGQVCLVPQNSKYCQYIVSSRQHFCRPLEENLQEYLFCFLTSGKGQHEILKNVVTTGVPSISRPVTNLKSIQLVLPEREVLKNFSQIVKPIIMNIRLNISIIRNLSKIKDFLLPKLISGEIKISDAESFIDEVGT